MGITFARAKAHMEAVAPNIQGSTVDFFTSTNNDNFDESAGTRTAVVSSVPIYLLRHSNTEAQRDKEQTTRPNPGTRDLPKWNLVIENSAANRVILTNTSEMFAEITPSGTSGLPATILGRVSTKEPRSADAGGIIRVVVVEDDLPVP